MNNRKITIRKEWGFTLIEVLLATIIGALVVVVALAAFRSVTQNEQMLEHYTQIMAHGRYAINQIRDDLANIYRDKDPTKIRFHGIKGKIPDKATDRLVMYVVSDKKVNPQEKEGDVYEVEYGISQGRENGTFYLGRRCGAVENELAGNQRGVLTRVAEYMNELKFEYFNGQNWQREWKQIGVLPNLVRVTMTLVDPERKWPGVVLSQEVALGPAQQVQWQKEKNVIKSDEPTKKDIQP